MQSTDYTISIDKATLAQLPTAAFQGEIITIQTLEQTEDAIAYLEQHKLVGFDTETKPSFKKGKPNKVALLQLSTDSRCYLFRLNKIGVPDPIVRFLENEGIMKIGLSVHDDFHVMHRTSTVEPKGFLELQDYVKKYKITDISLQKIYAIIFDQRISKSQRLTNWEADELTRGQQVYAATDAWACLQIYKHLTNGLFQPSLSPYKVITEPS